MTNPHPVQSYLSYSLATAHRKVHGSLSKRLKEFNVQVEAWRVMEILETGTQLTGRSRAYEPSNADQTG